MVQLYVDLDGVLADFNTGYELAFGYRPDKAKDDVDWKLVAEFPNFYLSLPPMPDFPALWARISRYQPIVLTGVPTEVPGADVDKRGWCNTYLGSRVMVATTRSATKAAYCRPGDVLIDDWEKYRQLWLDAGGRWITHVNAIETDKKLTEMGL
jgi:hypothetical protein